jgi:hypothetical protein
MPPAGLKGTSAIVQIGSDVTETAANTFTSQKIDLQLNPLDQEVFVILAVNLDLTAPDLLPGTTTNTNFSISSTQRTSVGSLTDSNVIAHKRSQIQDNGVTAVFDEHIAGETPAASLDYVYIVATNDFFLNITGTNNANAKTGISRVYGYRARASASVYAALVNSELLSA